MSEDLPGPIYDSSVQLLRELAAISSPSGDLVGLRRMTERLSEELSARGLTPEVHEESGEGGVRQPVLVARGPNTSRGHLLLIGHMDTVLPAAEPRMEGDRLVATGAIDMKGGFAAFLGALDLLAHRGVEPPDDLLLVVVPDEEVGGPISHASMICWGEGARALWVLEPGEPAEDAETMVAGRRGMFDWRLIVKGQAAHSGLHYWEGRSALASAARWTVEAQALSRRDGGPTVNVGRLVAGDASFVENLATAHSLVGTERQLNVVPDRAVVEGEARFLRPKEEPEIESRLRSLAEEIARDTGTEMAFTREPTIPPVDPDGPHRDICDRAVSLAAARGWTLEVERERGGISFPNFLPDPGRLPVLDGLGPVGGGMHTREEYVELRSLRRRVLLLADLLAAP
ncbi:MAG TPA: M20/M25/M40 family metallo-hydrolase [Thermoanaerobaculia bacterium]|nr:M20/M25/M40 family metallo-hydrolase [Thermoanaerobaculia bacterium]